MFGCCLVFTGTWTRLLMLLHAANSLSFNVANRRIFLSDLAATAALTYAPLATFGEDTERNVAGQVNSVESRMSTKIGHRVLIRTNVQMSPENTLRRSFVVGLYDETAPEATRVFSALAAGQLRAPCQLDRSGVESMQRSALTKKSIYRACLAGAEEPVGYDNSVVWRIIKDQRIDLGQVAGKYAYRIPPATPAWESAGLKHDRPGLVSVPREGGSFDFSVTLSSTPELDNTNKVIGEVLDGLDTVQLIGDLPVISYAGQGSGPESSRAKQCFYGSQDTFCSQLKPIKKVSVSMSIL